MACLISFTELRAQDIAQVLQEARRQQRAFNDTAALNLYLDVLQKNPQELTALCKASELYCITGKRLPRTEDQRLSYLRALELAQKAIRLHPSSAEANVVMSIAQGRLALIATGEEKVKAVKDIRYYAERAVQLDPSNFKGYHVLGKWHYEVSNLSAVERWLVKLFFGAFPESSFAESIRNYEKSRSLYPGFLLNYLEGAKAYYKNGQKGKAVEFLQLLSRLPDTSSDDPTIRSEARNLLGAWGR